KDSPSPAFGTLSPKGRGGKKLEFAARPKRLYFTPSLRDAGKGWRKAPGEGPQTVRNWGRQSVVGHCAEPEPVLTRGLLTGGMACVSSATVREGVRGLGRGRSVPSKCGRSLC